MTTNETLFFRDQHPFEALVGVMLPALLAARPRGEPIRIWSTAASAGQEPYSIAMLIRENAALVGTRPIEILASDISTEMIARAEEGLYTEFEIRRGLDDHFLQKYFSREKHGWRISEAIRRMVRFQRINLLEPFDNVGMFDIVYCRNVLIYFDAPTKIDVVERIARRMRPDGYLLLGGAETLVGMTDRFRPSDRHRALFQPSTGGASPGRRPAGPPPFQLGPDASAAALPK